MALVHYMLNPDHSIAATEDVIEWGRWFEDSNRIVVQEDVGGAWVSTVFLGIDHNHTNSGPPLLFETMVFRGDHGGEMDRYSTWEEAVVGHRRMCDTLTSGLSREELERSKTIIEALLTKG